MLLHNAKTTGALGTVFMAVLRLTCPSTPVPGATDLTRYGAGHA